MAGSYPQHDDAVQAFHTWRHSSEAQLPGIGGPNFDTLPSFIPLSNLKAYFERPRQLENLLDAVLDSNQRSAVDVNHVRNNYLQSFATLLCIGEAPMIRHFHQQPSLRDGKLPYHTRPDDFPCTTPDIFQEFKNAQWQFCASKLEYGMDYRFKEEDILPIIRKEKIGEGGSAIIYKIVVDEEYNSLLPRGDARLDRRRQYKNTFVLKTYRAAEAEENYKAERDAYMKLRWGGNPSLHIITYYGSFVHGNSYNIILEYADEGTLESFMKKTDQPSTVEEAILVWDRITDVTHGIMTIHGLTRNESSASQILKGLHQDIKPANILVFGGNGTSPYDCHFKIADMGLTRFYPVSQRNDPSGLDAFGTRAYGAPESFRSHVKTESAPLQVTPAVDIWSIGAVFSEVSVWANYGWKKVVEYRRQRNKEVEIKGGGDGEHVFHFEGDLLRAVHNIHQDILGKRFALNHITRSILEGLVHDMLQHGARPQAKLVFEKSKRLIKECRQKYGVPEVEVVGNSNGEPIDPIEPRLRAGSHFRVPPDHTHNPSQLSIGQHNGPREERESQLEGPLQPDDYFVPLSPESKSSPSRVHGHLTGQLPERRSVGASDPPQPRGEGSHVTPNPPPPPSTAPNSHGSSGRQPVQQDQEELVRPSLSIDAGLCWKRGKKNGEKVDLAGGENLTYLDQRNHIFLIDNSATMEQYKGDIYKVVSLLAYMLKPYDKEGLDIFFTLDPHKVNSRKSRKISSSVFHVPFVGISDMRGRLHSILQEHKDKFGTLISPPKTCFKRQPQQPQRPLSFYILTDAQWQPNDVGGLIKNLVGSMRDKGCPKEHAAIQFIRFGNDPASIAKLDELDHGLDLGATGMDIVDHTYWDGNVWKQLLGALNDWYDDDPP